MPAKRIVLDTNILISHALRADSPTGVIVSHLIASHTILCSTDTIKELVDVLWRSKFDRYISQRERLAYLEKYLETAEQVPVNMAIFNCEDPKDNRFLELAVSGNADLIVSGDPHLFNMHPYRGIRILRPGEIDISTV